MTPADHKHTWNVFITDKLERETRVISHSPCSTADDILATVEIQVQGCKCGARKRAVVGIDQSTERFRGDDQRRAAGMEPWGNLPGSHGHA